MPRWNNSLENNCKDILDNKIKNLRPDLYQLLLATALSEKLENNKKVIEQYVRGKLNLSSTCSKHCKEYWTLRGWTDSEAYAKAKDNKQKNLKSAFSREFWLNKTNPNTNLPYTIEEADFERNSRRPIRKEYWIAKGYSDEESKIRANRCKEANNKKGAISSAHSDVRAVSSKRCAEYYTSRGFTPKEAKEAVANNQNLFSKEICIQKYGNEDGIAIWQERQATWQATLNSKSSEEKARINRLKLTKGITVSKAERVILEAIKVAIPTAQHQFVLEQQNKKQYIYDIMANQKIIEYNGDFWHSNPDKYPGDFVNPRSKIKASDKWFIDEQKIQFAKDQGYEVLVVWERDFKLNREEVIQQCIQFLTQ